jgi:hypothetical protein
MRDYFETVLRKVIADPTGALAKILPELNYYGRRLNQQYYHLRGMRDESYDLMSEDWDTAIILDACRYDIFCKNHPEKWGIPEKKIAPGSHSKEYFQRTFSDDTYHDTIYITSNPYITTLPEDTFHAIELDEVWKEMTKQAPPEKMTEVAKEIHMKYPRKRIIVHYMQPHLPFYGEKGTAVWENLGFHRGGYFPKKTKVSDLREAYSENLQIVLGYVEELLSSIVGKTLITADHGELLGERMFPIPVRGFDHYPDLYLPELVQVPWLELESDKRRDIESEPPAEPIQIDESVRVKRLEALGYTE